MLIHTNQFSESPKSGPGITNRDLRSWLLKFQLLRKDIWSVKHIDSFSKILVFPVARAVG